MLKTGSFSNEIFQIDSEDSEGFQLDTFVQCFPDTLGELTADEVLNQKFLPLSDSLISPETNFYWVKFIAKSNLPVILLTAKAARAEVFDSNTF